MSAGWAEWPTLDDALEMQRGKSARDIGQDLAAKAADGWWLASVDAEIRRLAASGREFTADDVRKSVPDPVQGLNAMGGRFAAAARARLIVSVGYTTSSRSDAHARVLKTWRGVS